MILPLLLRQIWTLAFKDILLALNQKIRVFTIIRAFSIPTVFVIYISFIIRVYWPREIYGIGNPAAVRPLSDAIRDAPGSRRTLALCNYGSQGGDIDEVIDLVARSASGNNGQTIQVLHHPDELLTLCRSTLSGVTKCFAAAEFHSSPDQGGSWNYTLRVDGALGYKIDVEKNKNDAEIFLIPLQHAVDTAISSVSSESRSSSVPPKVHAYPYTSETQKEWNYKLVTGIQNAIAKYIAVVWYIAFIGLCYQLVGLMAREREHGMADLLESMMPNVSRWQPQMARLLGHWVAFTLIYFPSWIIIAIVARLGLYPNTNPIIPIIFFVLTGLSLNSFSILGASLFRRAQLSGITVVIVALGLGVAAQVAAKSLSTAAVAILGLLFTPMTFVFHMIWMAHYEHKRISPNLIKASPGASWEIPGLVFWICMLIQIVAYPVLAALIERKLHYPTSHGRTIIYEDDDQPIVLSGFTKYYQPSWFFRTVAPLFGIHKPTVKAVNDVSIAPMKGQIMVLVGANGCGKSTTLNAIAGLGDVTSGSIVVNGSGGIGICPQKNVLWDYLTVSQHAKIFNQLKSVTQAPNHLAELSQLVYDCGLSHKMQSYATTLSGGQKRKLQLVLMLTGGSQVCCVDEVSGGLDPLSRRKIWDILLAERGKRTIVLTTHFLDEAEFLADHMVVMSKGSVKAEGSVSQLKTQLGEGCRFHFLHGTGYSKLPDVEDLFVNIPKEQLFDQTIYTVPDFQRSANIIRTLESRGIIDYQVSGPTIEEVFMKIAGEPNFVPTSGKPKLLLDEDQHSSVHENKEGKQTVVQTTESANEPLMTGRPVGLPKQTLVMFKKRLTVFRRNYLPLVLALLIPILATGLVSILLKDKSYGGCSPTQQVDESKFTTLEDDSDYRPLLVIGPSSAFANVDLSLFQSLLPSQFGNAQSNTSDISQYISIVETIDQFHEYIEANFSSVSPGGFFLGEEPTFAFYSNLGYLGLYSSIFMQNAVNVLMTNTTITTNLRSFSYPWRDDTTDQYQFLFYFGLIMACYPAFFALYPTKERVLNIKALQYSNGVRPLSLWLAYLSFDWIIVLVSSSIMTIILATATPDNWWNIGYLFVVLFLYGLASLLWSYTISLFAKSQLAAFAIAAGSQAFLMLMYFTGWMQIQSNVDASEIDSTLTIFNLTFTIITPIGNLLRSLIIAMNLFSPLCRGTPPRIATYGGEFKLYGAPILYLLFQSAFLFFILLSTDYKWTARWFKTKAPAKDPEDQDTCEQEVLDEINRVAEASDGLRVQHLTRHYKSKTKTRAPLTAVDDLTFGVQKGEVFSIIGPNGAGKSTTISMLRGEIPPSRPEAEIHLGDVDVLREKSVARARFGICPQFDAIDQMTVLEHLVFYAGVRGVSDPKLCAEQVVNAVGLDQFKNTMGSKLSGGNKRKLSLGIALTGNPELVLLDEPSSGMDPLAKRIMWKTLIKFVPGRSVLLTTHSMEEAVHLADRVGFLAKRMLDVGTTSHLRNKHGHGFHLQLICASAPNTPDDQIESIKQFVEEKLPGSKIEGFAYHGQMRFSVPAKGSITSFETSSEDKIEETIQESEEDVTVGKLYVLLEEHRERLGLEFYSVSPSTFDEVFLKVIDKHKNFSSVL
ncbi:ATP-binding cassette sub-family A member 7 [Aaosphaeria arxii CBS 175.79]|uniref:ATP-binding cassette sub-family A member 7 n=1 Tax=Aaosphaeria arxii CBS 175.79 TaxID=1450172 RepID=A0A6A5XBD7_9PLEO|nr:ATP-binding cassette sub-family A member 7 [Aaosphaeria arxii CBS 175.79]KAF2010084.1 ATP-binding cassette sub-family A member 7 [Aaosphaeria arxii CBS 175.79]